MSLTTMTTLILCSLCGGTPEFHVALGGKDTDTGSRDAPFATLERARDAIRELKQAGPLPDGGVTVWIHEGVRHLDTTLRLGPQDSGARNAPVVYRACDGADVVFDGSRPIDAKAFRKVEDPATLSRLCPAARGNVLQAAIADEAAARALANAGTRLSIDGRMLQLARFPDVGYCHVDRILEKGAVYARGRTKGPPPAYSKDAPAGGLFTILEKPSGDWEAELRRIRKADVSGYLAYDWYRERHRIASIRDGAIRLLEYSRYGVLNSEKIPRRLVVRNLLCELSRPGEWYFDEARRMLFLWPFEPPGPRTRLGCWAGPPFAVLSGTSHVTIRGVTVQCTASGEAMVVIKGGADNLVAGCTFRDSTRTGVVLSGGARNGIVGCDLYDLESHLTLDGGDSKTLAAAGNYARNNHFTQVESQDLYGRVRIRGVGNVFQNNLLHNFAGQPVTVGGNDHLFELNEIFNVGIEEGDGGAVYSGAQMWSYGNVYRHNFLHHLMCVPQAHPRGGIYPDDLDGGDTITGNVFYKAAHRAVLLNGGAANVVTNNIFIRGYIGVYSTEAWAEGIIAAQPKYDSGELKRGDKNDHIWRTEQAVGKEGWNRPPWSTRYPLFRKVMNQPRRRFYPIECTVSHNLFCGNRQNTAFRRAWGERKLIPIEDVDYFKAEDNRDVPLDVFVDPASLDFRFKKGRRPEGFGEIPFERIGLYADQYRKRVPDKRAYRRMLRKKWERRESYDEKAVYDPGTITDLLYYNTGKLVMATARARSAAHGSKRAGFASLFDGKTLDGWRAVPEESAADWSIRDGAIVGHGSAKRLAYLVWKEENLADFELRLRYRLPGKGNTGVEIRAQPDSTGKRPFEGYHADLGHVGIGAGILGAWDFHFARRKEPPCPRGTRLVIDKDGKTRASAIPGALTRSDVRPHQWNDVRVLARGNHFQFFINGKLASEFTDNAKRGRLDHGAIGLQIHDKGMVVEFRDIRLKRLRS